MACCNRQRGEGFLVGALSIAALEIMMALFQVYDGRVDERRAEAAMTEIDAALASDGRYPGVHTMMGHDESVVLYGWVAGGADGVTPGALQTLAAAAAPKATIESVVVFEGAEVAGRGEGE
jgi:hypothetical protein